MTLTEVPDEVCACSHHRQLHAPGGVLADTTERGHGPCTCKCICNDYLKGRKR
jgi:hypothetical protein